MKDKINSLNDALAFLLQGLYYTETRLKEEFPSCCERISSNNVTAALNAYILGADTKLLKLERVFNYLAKGRLNRKNGTINELLREMQLVTASTSVSHLRDMVSIGYIQNINAYKISCYRSAYMFAVELELNTPTDLLQEILESEVQTSRSLSQLTIEEFNKIPTCC